MADLLPSIPDSSAPEDAEPRVVGLDDEDADDVLGALSSTTARELFAALNDDPAHPSALADRVDTSLQNVQYHLEKLDDAGMVEVVDTAYSEKGREMDVYAPADRPLVLFAGDEEDETLLHRALGRLLGGVGVLAGATLSIRGLVGADGTGGTTGQERMNLGSAGSAPGDDREPASAGGDTGGTNGGDAAAGGSNYSADSTNTNEQLEFAEGAGAPRDSVDPLATELAWVVDPLQATGLPPELLVLVLGGALLAIGTGAWYWRERQTRV